MMCEPGERDLADAARRALAEARARGLAGDALVEAAIETVAAIWAHVDPSVVRSAVVSCLAERGAAPGSG